MDQTLERTILDLVATNRRIGILRSQRKTDHLSPSELMRVLADEDYLRLHLDEVTEQVDLDIITVVRFAASWTDVADIASTVVDICARAAEADFLVSRPSATVRRPVSPLHSFGRLTLDAAQTAILLAAATSKTFKLQYKTRLVEINLALDDLLTEMYERRV